MTPSQLLLTLFGIALGSGASLLLKIGANRLSPAETPVGWLWQVAQNPWLMIGLAGHFATALLWIWMLKRVPLSLLQPMFALVYVITPALAFLFLKEAIPAQRLIGIAVIVVGVVLVART